MNQQENLKTDGQASSECNKPSVVDESVASERESNVSVEPRQQKGPSKRSRTTFTPAQQVALEQAFLTAPYPDSSARQQISKVTGIAEDKVQVCLIAVCRQRVIIFQQLQIWFQNRRARYRKKDKPRKQQRQRQIMMQMMSQTQNSKPIVPVYPTLNLFPAPHGAFAHVVPPCVPFPMLGWPPHLHAYHPPPPTSSGQLS